MEVNGNIFLMFVPSRVLISFAIFISFYFYLVLASDFQFFINFN